MHEYEILYQKWKSYRRKKIAYRLFVIFTLCLAIIGGYRYLLEQKRSEPSTKPTTAIKKTKNLILPSKNFESQLHTYKEKKRSAKKRVDNKPTKYPVVKKEKKRVLITSQSISLADLKASFNSNPSAQKALLIARYYFDKGDYKNAAKWAYKANTLDKTNEETWLLFAKAVAKTGKRKEAVKILRIYYKKSKSPKAKLLLEKIVQGEIR